MTTELKVHPSFFREFATKTWVSPNEIIKELVENAFDEDATKVLISLLEDGTVVVEDDAGMGRAEMEKFLILGSPHKRQDSISPKLKRLRTGRYGTGRLSFLTSFDSMLIRTKRDEFAMSVIIDGNTLDRLFTGNAKLDEVDSASLKRNGTELTLKGSKIKIDPSSLAKEIRKLAILRQPIFEVFVKTPSSFNEWDFNGSVQIKAADIQGHRLPVNLDNGKIIGEIVIARRPLSEDEKGIAVMVGNHIVIRSNFGFDTKLNRVTGFVRCDNLTSRFADKSAIIEDEEYTKFNQQLKTFIIDTVLPSLTEYEDVLITREESKIYKEIDKVLGQAIIENLETQEEVQGYELVDINEVVNQNSKMDKADNVNERAASLQGISERSPSVKEFHNTPVDEGISAGETSLEAKSNDLTFQQLEPEMPQKLSQYNDLQSSEPSSILEESENTLPNNDSNSNSNSNRPQETEQVIEEKQPDGTVIRTRKIRKPIVKKTFALKKVGYKVIPYEDESDSRYSFTNESVVFVNKANSTYKAEALRGDEFLLRHIISIVAEAVAESKHPEGKEALALQNRLVAEAIRIHDYSVMKR